MMITSFDETGHLRGRLRKEWPSTSFGELIWVEAARGGTVGAPDVNLPLGGSFGYCPVELKAWEELGGCVRFYARPSQRRFHLLASFAGNRTAFVAVTQRGNIVAMPNWRMPKNGELIREGVTRIGSKCALSCLRELLLAETFWERR